MGPWNEPVKWARGMNPWNEPVGSTLKKSRLRQAAQPHQDSEASGDPHVVEIAEMIANFGIVQDSAEATEGDAHAGHDHGAQDAPVEHGGGDS